MRSKTTQKSINLFHINVDSNSYVNRIYSMEANELNSLAKSKYVIDFSSKKKFYQSADCVAQFDAQSDSISDTEIQPHRQYSGLLTISMLNQQIFG